MRKQLTTLMMSAASLTTLSGAASAHEFVDQPLTLIHAGKVLAVPGQAPK